VNHGLPVVAHQRLGAGAPRAETRHERQQVLQEQAQHEDPEPGPRADDLHDDHAAARPKHAPVLPEGLLEVRHVAERVAHAHHVEPLVDERKGFADAPDEAPRGHLTALPQHPLAGIEAHQVLRIPEDREGLSRDEARAGGHVEELHARPQAGPPEDFASIGRARPRGHDSADPVVVLGRVVEEAVHDSLPLLGAPVVFGQGGMRGHAFPLRERGLHMGLKNVIWALYDPAPE